ncbi:MAG: response regulator transcription factor, partial [Bacteroidota bacterium]
YALGIDDYITKPFDEDVLLCKINAIMTRAGKEPATGDCFPLAIGEYRFDPLNQRLIYKGAEKRLTKKETEVLELLAGTKNQLVKRTYILNSVWGNDDYFTGRSLDVFVTKLRKYLENDPTVKIESIPTVGYILTDTR